MQWKNASRFTWPLIKWHFTSTLLGGRFLFRRDRVKSNKQSCKLHTYLHRRSWSSVQRCTRQAIPLEPHFVWINIPPDALHVLHTRQEGQFQCMFGCPIGMHNWWHYEVYTNICYPPQYLYLGEEHQPIESLGPICVDHCRSGKEPFAVVVASIILL